MSNKLKAIVLSKNYEGYRSGYYHQDLINALKNNMDVFIYGPGYDGYDENDNISDVISKSAFDIKDVFAIFASTSWDDDTSDSNVDPHPKIELSEVKNIKKIYFLNKEYKKLNARFEYCKKNKFDVVFTVHPNANKWAEEEGINIKQLHFGIDLDRFKYQGEKKKIDFAFTGSLHRGHLDYRFNVKKEIFKESRLNTKSNLNWMSLFGSLIKDNYCKYNIYWAEFGARDILFKSLIPFDKEYGAFLKKTKMVLNTPSAVGIFNTRFFELMASKTLILCPRVNAYDGILKDGINCLMYNPDMSDFHNVFSKGLNDEVLRNSITEKAFEDVSEHSYDARVLYILSELC